MTTPSQRKQLKSDQTFFYGWIIVAACLVILIISGTTYYSFSLFFKPLQDEFGWDRTLTSSANMVFLLVYAVSLYIMTQVERFSIQRRKIVIPAEAGIQKKIKKLDSCFHRNDRFLFHLLSGVSYSVKTFVSLYIAGLFNKKSLNLGMSKLADKYGLRLVLTGGALFLGSGFALCSQIHSIWHLYLFLTLAALGQGTIWSLPLATVQRWFSKRRGLVLGIVTSGVGFGVMIFMPLISQLISAKGWRSAYVYLGVGSWFLLTLASIAMAASPEVKGLRPYGLGAEGKPIVKSSRESKKPQGEIAPQWVTGEAVRTKTFIMLVVIYTSAMMSINMIAAHFVRFAIDMGVEQKIAASAYGLIGGASVAGKIIIGTITERMGWNWSLIICCFGAASVILTLLAVRDTWAIYLFAIFYGFFYGGTILLVPGLTGYLFGTLSLAQIIGIITGIGIAFSSVGPVTAGFVFDKTGSYAISFILAAASFGLAGILALVIRSPQKAS